MWSSDIEISPSDVGLVSLTAGCVWEDGARSTVMLDHAEVEGVVEVLSAALNALVALGDLSFDLALASEACQVTAGTSEPMSLTVQRVGEDFIPLGDGFCVVFTDDEDADSSGFVAALDALRVRLGVVLEMSAA